MTQKLGGLLTMLIGVVLVLLGLFAGSSSGLAKFHLDGVVAFFVFLLSGFFFFLGYKIFVGVKKK